MNISKSLSWIIKSIHSSHSEHIVLQTLVYHITPCSQVFLQFSIIAIAYPNLWFNLSYITFLVPMSKNCIPPSRHTVVCKLHSSPFLTNYILLKICMVCLVSLPFLSIDKADLLSNLWEVLVMEPYLGPCLETHYLASWSVISTFL